MKIFASVVLILIVFAFFVFGVSSLLKIISNNADNQLILKNLHQNAEILKRVKGNPELSHDDKRKIAQAIEILSNDVLDKKAMIFYAKIKTPAKGGHPLLSDCPTLIWLCIDELQRAGSIDYTESNEPNASGNQLLLTGDFNSLLVAYEPDKYLPIKMVAVKCNGETEKVSSLERLTAYEHGDSTTLILEVNVTEWNALLQGKGQLILKDRVMNRELDRTYLKFPTDPNDRRILESLMIKEVYPTGGEQNQSDIRQQLR